MYSLKNFSWKLFQLILLRFINHAKLITKLVAALPVYVYVDQLVMLSKPFITPNSINYLQEN